MNISLDQSVGIIKPKSFRFAEHPKELQLESGKNLGPIVIEYETYGNLSASKDNAILVVHALTGDAHAAGYHSEVDRKPGWWDRMIGPGKAFDTDKYFVICSNVIGSCMGSTGPKSVDPRTKLPYGLSFPMITIGDMVNAQHELLLHLGIERLLTVAGGSIGGMQVLQWAVSFPEMLRSAIPIATTSRLSPQAIAFNEVGRQAIMTDQNWQQGNYYGKSFPDQGLAIARMIGHITYLSDESMHLKFGRRLQDKEKPSFSFLTEYQVESYLHHQGDTFVKRFDANSYLYLTKAMDYFDLASYGDGSLVKAFSNTKCPFMVTSISSDWLFPPYQSKEIVSALRANLIDTTYAEIKSSYGHDAFLLEVDILTRYIKNFLNKIEKQG